MKKIKFVIYIVSLAFSMSMFGMNQQKKSGQQRIFESAYESRKYSSLRAALRKACDNHEKFDGEAALAATITSGNFSLVKLLLDQGIPVHTLKIQEAFREADKNGYHTIVCLLLERGLFRFYLEELDFSEYLWAVSARNGYLAGIKKLLEDGIDINAVDYYACQKSLLNSSLYTGTSYISYNDDCACDYPITLLDINGSDHVKIPNTALSYAVRTGQKDVVAYLLEHGVNSDKRYLIREVNEHKTIAQIALEIIKDLDLVYQLDPSKKNAARLTLQEEIFTLLLDHNPKLIFTPARTGKTMLHYAVRHGLTQCVRVLLERGAKVNKQDYIGRTPLHRVFSIRSVKTRREIAQLLVDAGADVTITNTAGMSVLEAVREPEYHCGLGNCIYDIINLAAQNKPAQQQAFTLKKNKQKHKEAENSLPKQLHKAVKKGKTTLVKDFVRNPKNFTQFYANPAHRVELYKLIRMLNVHSQDNGRKYNFSRKRTAGVQEILSILVEDDSSNLEQLFKDMSFLHYAILDDRLDIVEILVKNFNAPLNAQDEFEATALHYAVARRNAAIVELLLSHGADPNTQDENSLTPLEYDTSDERITTLLLLYGANSAIVERTSESQPNSVKLTEKEINLLKLAPVLPLIS